jgi:AcrR family transcriptional regulator
VVRNRRGISTRAAILEAAHRLLKERGFEALSLDAVARAARVTRSSVYHQFHSRDGLFLQLIGESIRRLQPGGRTGADHKPALERFLVEAEAGFRGDPNLLRMFYLLVFDRSWNRPELKRLLHEAYRFRTQRLAAALSRDRMRVTSAEAEMMAIVLVAALDGLYARHLIDLRGARLKQAFRTITDLVGSRIRPREKRTGHQ